MNKCGHDNIILLQVALLYCVSCCVVGITESIQIKLAAMNSDVIEFVLAHEPPPPPPPPPLYLHVTVPPDYVYVGHETSREALLNIASASIVILYCRLPPKFVNVLM